MQTLVDVALGGILPKQCNEWVSSSHQVHENFMQKRREKKSAVAHEIGDTKDSLRHVLRKEVVNYVINIFP